MKCVKIDSRTINEVCFDALNNEMLVHFHSGETRIFISFNGEDCNPL